MRAVMMVMVMGVMFMGNAMAKDVLGDGAIGNSVSSGESSTSSTVIVSQTSDRTYAVNDGKSSGVVVVN